MPNEKLKPFWDPPHTPSGLLGWVLGSRIANEAPPPPHAAAPYLLLQLPPFTKEHQSLEKGQHNLHLETQQQQLREDRETIAKLVDAVAGIQKQLQETRESPGRRVRTEGPGEARLRDCDTSLEELQRWKADVETEHQQVEAEVEKKMQQLIPNAAADLTNLASGSPGDGAAPPGEADDAAWDRLALSTGSLSGEYRTWMQRCTAMAGERQRELEALKRATERIEQNFSQVSVVASVFFLRSGWVGWGSGMH